MTGSNGNLGDESADVCVIGAGPAGTTTATLLKLAMPTARIVICERAEFPRHHIGESLLPNANPVLARMGVIDKLDGAGFQRKGGVSIKLREGHPMIREWFVAESERHLHGAERRVIPHHAWQVQRSRYDKILLDHAIEMGVEVRQPAAVKEFLRDGMRVNGVVIDEAGAQRRITTRFVVDCSGQARLLGRALGLDLIEHDLGDLAIYRYYDGADWSDDLLGSQDYSKVFFAVAPPVGWVWYIALSPTLVSVGVVTRKHAVTGRSVDDVFDETLQRVPEMKHLLRSAWRVPAACDTEPITRTHTAANWSYAHARAAGPGWYLAGDAAAFVDPVLSSGVMLAHYGGLWVANAILTELQCPEIDQAELHRAYREVYEDARDGFGDMASWWYSQSDKNMDETWVEHGAKLMRSRQARGAEGMDDISAFISLVAGRLTDFRFRFVGLGGFESKGVADVGAGAYDTNLDKQVFGLADRSCSVARAWDRCERDWYLGTYVESNRWWRLPMVRFFRGDTAIEYRPRVHFLPSGDPDIEQSVRVVDALLAAVETSEIVADLEWEVRRRETAGEVNTALAQLGDEVIQDLMRLELLQIGEPTGAPRKGSSQSLAPGTVLAPAFDDCAFELVDVGSFHENAAPLAVWTFALPDRKLRYAPLCEPSVAESLLQACDGRRSVEEIVAGAVPKRAEGHPEQARAAVRRVAEELVQLGILQATGQSMVQAPVERKRLPAAAETILADGVSQATGGTWRLGASYCDDGRISAQLDTPEGSLTLEMAMATGSGKAYKVLNGVSYWYQKEDNAAPPSLRVLQDLDKVLKGLQFTVPPTLQGLTAEEIAVPG